MQNIVKERMVLNWTDLIINVRLLKVVGGIILLAHLECLLSKDKYFLQVRKLASCDFHFNMTTCHKSLFFFFKFSLGSTATLVNNCQSSSHNEFVCLLFH